MNVKMVSQADVQRGASAMYESEETGSGFDPAPQREERSRPIRTVRFSFTTLYGTRKCDRNTYKVCISLADKVIRHAALKSPISITPTSHQAPNRSPILHKGTHNRIELHAHRRSSIRAGQGVHGPAIYRIRVHRRILVVERAQAVVRRRPPPVGREGRAVVEHDLARGVEASDGERRRGGGEDDVVGGVDEHADDADA